MNHLQIIVNSLSNGIVEISLLIALVIIIVRQVADRCTHQV